MGCLQSKPATPEEEQEICKVMGKDMCYLCLKAAFERNGELGVEIPTQMQEIRDLFKAEVDKIKPTKAEGGGEAAEAPAAEGAASAEEPAAAGGGGGLLGKAKGLLNTAVDKATEVMAKAVDMSADVLEKTMLEAVSAMDLAIEQVTAPLKTVGEDVYKANKEKILLSMKEYIDKMDFPEARSKTVTGAPKGCTDYAWASQEAFVQALQSAEGVDEAIKKHKSLEAWQQFMDKYGKLRTQFQSVVNLPVIEIDLKAYICQQTIKKLFDNMGQEEQKYREEPGRWAEAEFPEVFEKVFTMEKQNKDAGKKIILTQNDYNAIVKKRNAQKAK